MGGRTTEYPDRQRLSLTFDPAPLAAEAAALPAEAWEPHFNTQQYEGDWSGVALRAAAGSPLALYPDPSSTEHVDTEWLDRCPATVAVLARVPAPLLTVRFLRLGPGARILRHRDYRLDAESGEARLHLPVESERSVEFLLDGTLVPMVPGECWYLDLSRHHEVDNRSSTARLHLVIDVVADSWLLDQLADVGDASPADQTRGEEGRG